MAAFQLLVPLLLSCASAVTRPPHHLPACRAVQLDVFCRNLSLRSVPLHLPQGVQTLDLSHNQLQNLTQEALAHHTSLRRLNLHSNKIHFIQPKLFEDMTDLKVLDMSRNHLNVFALSKTNIGPLTAVESLDLSTNGIHESMTDYFLSKSPSLSNLSLSSNSITKIRQNMFSGSSALRKISLHNNVILEIESGGFDSLSNLTELDLSKNSISCITDFNLLQLKVLNLSQNSMETFRSSISDDVYELLHLDLSQNKMPYFPLVPKKNKLEYLDVSRNQLQTTNITGSREELENFRDTFLSHTSLGFSNTHQDLSKLKHLDMSYNQLKIIPQSFLCCMPSLQVLNVSNNCVGSFSIINEGLLQIVKIIDLSYNSLQTLTFGESTLQSLEQLFLQGNDLTTLEHPTFQRLPKIKYLQLQQNRLKICTPDQDPPGCVSFGSVSNLQYLYLSENHLKTLPANAFSNTPLRLLDLSLNPGLDMDSHSLTGLEYSLVDFFLQENNISRLNVDLSSLRSLKFVDLSTNQLTTLPQWNKDSSIESLNLRHNNLVTLEYSTVLALERSLKTLYMGSNPLSCCSNLRFLHMVRRSAVVVPDIETVTCVYVDDSEPINIEQVTQDSCRTVDIWRLNLIVVIVTTLALILVLGLLVKLCHSRKQKRNRSFST
ncbi:transforming growth factor beta activator LRRC32 isoform X2 [Thalassophryne amazonica]|nr:transforming growth factor beta activator LRRC32 isoform X2 [Thalassophryne amazonica]XP_034033583.1 transforming growth factor beta activator LRRC32 isoform X2 [Thalassophryne amazonica]